MRINGMELMKDTGSLMNAICANDRTCVRVGDTFTELHWSDRTLHIVTEVSENRFSAVCVSTHMKNHCDGTCYPDIDENGKWMVLGSPKTFSRNKRGWWSHGGRRVHISWGDKTGYMDPSF